jgi:hypothetical protein
MKKRSIAGVFLGLLSTLGCTTHFDPGSRVVSFRVLAEQADQPFARPGETVSIRSLSYDPEGRSVNWAWAACVNPSASTVQGCLDKIGEDSQATGSSPILAQGAELDHFSYTVPPNVLDSLPTGAKSSAMVGILSVACPGDLSLEDGPNNLPFSCKERGTGRAFALDEYIFGLKRVQVRSSDRNQNPVIEQVTFDGQDWPEGEVKQVTACDTDNNDYTSCSASSKHQLSARPTLASIESGTTEFGVGFTEQVVIEYYATEGIFEHEVKIAAEPQSGWVARKSASGKDLVLWMVVHDDRGGASWATRQVHAQ